MSLAADHPGKSIVGADEDPTRTLIIDAAEDLFGRQGIAATSLRSIVRAADQKNMSAIHYHFGTKAALVHEIVTTRREEVDAQVGHELRTGDLALEALPFERLLRSALRPVFNMKNAQGRRAYCLFVRAVLVDVNYQNSWLDLTTLGPNMQTLADLMRRTLDCSDAQFRFRATTLHQCFYHAASEYDAQAALGRAEMSEDAFFEEITHMLARAWTA